MNTLKTLNDSQREAVAMADAHASNAGLPAYTELVDALRDINFVLTYEGDESVIAPAYRSHLLGILARFNRGAA